MTPALLLVSPIIRRQLAVRKALLALKALEEEILSPVDQGFLRLAQEVFSKDEQGKVLAPAK